MLKYIKLMYKYVSSGTLRQIHERDLQLNLILLVSVKFPPNKYFYSK